MATDTREFIKQNFTLLKYKLNLTDEDIERMTDETIAIGNAYRKPEFNEVDWFGDFFLGVLLAASCEGEYTVTKKG